MGGAGRIFEWHENEPHEHAASFPPTGKDFSNRSEAQDVTGSDVGASSEGIILGGDNTGGRLIGVYIALEIVDERGASVETQAGMAGGVEFNSPTEIESVAPGTFIGGRASRDKSLVVMDETVADVCE
jgi:hypothetical protein